MKKITLIISMFFSLIISAQNGPEIWMSYELKPKKGMEDKSIQAAAKKMKKYNSTADNPMFTFEIMDGENQGMYSRVVGWKDWSYMNSQEDRSEELKYWKDNVDPFIEESTGWKVWRRLVGISHNWTPTTTFKYMLVQRRFIKPGHDQAVVHFLQRAKMVYEKHNYTGITGIFRVISGGNTNEYIICDGFNEYGVGGEFPDTEKNMEELYNEMFGWEAYRKDAQEYNDALEMYSRTTERHHFNEKLSTALN